MSEPHQDMVYDNGKFTPRKPEHFQREFHLTIFAVGATIEGALNALGTTNKWGDLTKIEHQPVDVPCKWYVRFRADGTSMKAAGEYVSGGVIVTWWK